MFQCSLREAKQLAVLASYFNPANSGVYSQTVRYKRKPRWIPMAKSKLFRIPVRPVIPQEDVEELKRLHNNYRTQMRSIRKFLYDEMVKEALTLENAASEQSLREEALEFEQSMIENDRWNAEVAKTREERLKMKADSREEKMLQLITKRDETHQRNLEIAEEKVRQYKMVEFISRDKLDEAIEKSLTNIVDYNYAIDMDGNIYPGREGDKPLESQEDDQHAEANS